MPKAHKLNYISSEEMLELAASGAKVLHIRAVEYARRQGVTLHVRSSFSDHEGTIVYNPDRAEEYEVEAAMIAGVAHDLSQAKITIAGSRMCQARRLRSSRSSPSRARTST